MLVQLLAQTMSPGQRIDAVHGHFAGRSGGEGLTVLYATLIIAVLLAGLLLIVHRIQRAKADREERARDELRKARTSQSGRPGQASRKLTLIQTPQSGSEVATRAPVTGARR
jgi:hypothetical protein